MNAAAKFESQSHIKVRQNLDFKLNEMPKYWFGDDPFKTRFIEAVSMSFPDGERYFIESVRAYRDDITDKELKLAVKNFIMQEAQHGIAHDNMNSLLKQQGMPVDDQVDEIKRQLSYLTQNRSRKFNIAYTAGCEHMTAMLAKAFYSHQETMRDSHPNMRAMFAWHAIEEMEHRSVCFDVMKDIADVGYPMRVSTMLMTGVALVTFSIKRTDALLKADGFSKLKRAKMITEGMKWLFGKQGALSKVFTDYLDYFRPDFHPDDHTVVHNYNTWVEHFERDGNALNAGQKFWEAAH